MNLLNFFKKKKDYQDEIFQRDFLQHSNLGKINADTNKINSGKSIVMTNPLSARYTFTRQLAGEDNKKFHPKTADEKETLSPRGFFRGKEIDQEGRNLVNNRLAKVEERRKAEGKAPLTADQKDLVKEQAENERMYETDIPSTALKYVKYDPKTQELYVKFQGSNKKYWYPRVPKEKVEELMKAPSKGEYFIKNIHDVYTVNPGHRPENNSSKNKVVGNYYGKMKKWYRNVRKTGRM